MVDLEGTLYIGIMSGTSVDAIDVALVCVDDQKTTFLDGIEYPFLEDIREQILMLCQTGEVHLKALGELQVKLSLCYGEAVNVLLEKQSINANQIRAVGCHGQTVYHHPFGQYPFSMQLLNASVLTANTGITTISDFRSMDIALGGQGAPLVPPFHRSLLLTNDKHKGVFVNIGGIANISVIDEDSLIGYDTGPGNVLLDIIMQNRYNLSCDKNGQKAAQGQVCKPLLDAMLSDQYFAKTGEKSTGREYFNLDWLNRYLGSEYIHLSDKDLLRTLVELTAVTIANGIGTNYCHDVYVCGGGIKNQLLMACLQRMLPKANVKTTQALNVDPDYIEAVAFAWLAHQCINRKVGNSPSVTGASKAAILGNITPVI
ncbi:anhydro-N-acetylmuramic acid kinase [Thalassotalea ganghwensis]